MAKRTRSKEKKEPRPPLSKDERLFQNIFKTTQEFILGKGFKPTTEADLFKKLTLPMQYAPLFHEVVKALVHQGVIALSKGKYSLAAPHKATIQGIISMHPRGFGFLEPFDTQKYPEEIFIPKHLVLNAIDGDTVEGIIENVSEKGPEGRVVAIVSRDRTHVVGTVRAIERNGQIVVHVPLLGPNQRVVVELKQDQALIVGDRVHLRVTEWGDKDSDTYCELSKYLGHISDASKDVPVAIIEYEIRETFHKRIINEATQYGDKVSAAEIKNREDLRQLECFTIDPDTAKDFDDAISLSKDKNNHYLLGVHIADVSHYVQPGSSIDEEALLRCNSTYFPGYCVPMLPNVLSDNLCSLKPLVNRLTVSVFMTFDAEGNLLNYNIVRSVIKSAKRFTYREAKEVLDGKQPSKFLSALERMVEFCKILKRKRYERGSIEFAIPELVVRVDDKGEPYGTEYVEYDITHQLVEEFMLKANEIVALHLSNQGKNLTFRIHEEPSPEHMRDFASLVSAFGFRLPETPSPREIQILFDEAMQTPYGPYLASSYIRRMRLALYSPDNIGHFGLSLSHYCHFTSPIRRYVDLVAHRLLFGEKDDREDLEEISKRASERERVSAKAENSVLLLKKLRLLLKYQQENPHRQFEAVITRVKNFGLVFEVIGLMLEGFIHISEIGDDYYVFEEAEMRLRGRSTNQMYCVGEKITVMINQIDLITSEVSWHFVRERRLTKQPALAPERKPFGTHRKPFGAKKVFSKNSKVKPKKGQGKKKKK